MELSYKTQKVKKLFEPSMHNNDVKYLKTIKKEMKTDYLVQCFIQRVGDLHDATTLYDIKCLKSANLHNLKGTKRYELAIDVDTDSSNRGKLRIVFETVDGENVCDDFYNDHKHKTVTHIHILAVGDYH